MTRVYGRWAGNPRGHMENTENCIVEISDTDGWHRHQCYRRRVHGKDGLYCKQHARMIDAGTNPYIPKEER